MPFGVVTFMFGNGLDLEFGLKTKYSDFLKYYTKLGSNDRVLKEFRTGIARDMDSWADAEVEMGKYTQYISFNERDKLKRRYDDFISELNKYFIDQQQLIIDAGQEKEIARRLKNGLANFYTSQRLPKISRKVLYNQLINQKDVVVNILDFNYTTIVDIAYEIFRGKNLICRHLSSDGKDYDVLLGAVCHVHGKLNDKMILGVDNKEQVVNKELLKDPDFVNGYIKPQTNASLGNGNDRTAANFIQASSVICIYGMSIGETDKTWWKYIVKWLEEDRNHQLVIFTYDSSYDNAVAGAYNKIADAVRRKLQRNGDVKEEEWQNINEQVHVAVNAKLFGGSLKLHDNQKRTWPIRLIRKLKVITCRCMRKKI